MTRLHEARFYEPRPDGSVVCTLCPHDRPVTEAATLRRAREIGLRAGLKYVYEGNIPGAGGENTYCPNFKQLLIERYGFHVHSNRIRDSRCPDCGERIDGVGMGVGAQAHA